MYRSLILGRSVVMLALFCLDQNFVSRSDAARYRHETTVEGIIASDGNRACEHQGVRKVQADSLERDRIVWGKPTNGLRAALELVPYPETLTFGTVVGVHIHVQNVSSQPISFSTELVRQDDEARVRNDAGREVFVSSIYHSYWPRPVQLTIPPGKESVLSSGALEVEESYEKAGKFTGQVQHILVCPPGDYTILFEVHIGALVLFDASGNQRVPAEGEWKGTVDTGTIPISVGR
ncbi:MAG TPA: hypothetical protein VE398_19370 [Acidobacteriota bacterium]|nr:hypothetical protein [Acidobacteriota bacterium]